MRDLETKIIESGRQFFTPTSLASLEIELREMEVNSMAVVSHYIGVIQENNIVKLEVSILTNKAIIDIVLKETIIIVWSVILEKVGFVKEEKQQDRYSASIFPNGGNPFLSYNTYNIKDTYALKEHIKEIKKKLY